MSEPIIWHNPRCSKSRQTLAILEEAGLQPAIVRYLEDSPTEAELRAALKLLGVGPKEIIRESEAVYKELGLRGATDDALIAAMAAHPILIERPVVFHKGKAALGRPPESVLDIL